MIQNAYLDEIWGIIIVSIIISLITCIALYCAGYYGGSVLLDKLSKKSNKCKNGIEFSQKIIERHGIISITVARLIPFSRTYISLVAGSLKCNFYSYIIGSSLGISVWNIIAIKLGITIFDNMSFLKDISTNYKILILIFVNVSIIVLLVRKYIIKKR